MVCRCYNDCTAQRTVAGFHGLKSIHVTGSERFAMYDTRFTLHCRSQ